MISPKKNGFTLIEITVVMVIVGIIISIIATTLPFLIQSNKTRDTRAILEMVDYSIQGYISANGRCPCPDTDNDGQENRVDNGTAADFTDDTCTSYVGTIPHRTLGIASGEDVWHNLVKYGVYEDLIKTTPSNFCTTLASIILFYTSSPYAPAKLHTTDSSGNSSSQAYVIISGGGKDKDGANGFFDGKNGAVPSVQLEVPDKIIDAVYDDMGRSVSFSYLNANHCTEGSCADVESIRCGNCDDGVDNDNDGSTDCFDSDCASHPECVNPSCDISTASPLPSGNVNEDYSMVTFSASAGCIHPVEWELINNGGFADFSIHQYTGVLTGSLSQCPGTYSIEVKATDSENPSNTSQESFLIEVTSNLTVARTSGGGSSDITWDSTTMEESFSANGGHIGDITWILNSGGATGFTLVSTGAETAILKKNGSTPAGTYTFIVTAADSSCPVDNTADMTLSVNVTNAGTGSPGEISAIIDTLEFDTSNCYEPSFINVNGDVFAIAYRGQWDDGDLKTVEIGSSGDITNSVIDHWEISTLNGYEHNIIHVSGDIFAIAYRDIVTDGHLKTINIASNGQIASSSTDTEKYDSSNGYEPDLIHVSGNVFALVYRGSYSDGWLKTMEIAANGTITNITIDSLEFDSSNGYDPDIIHVSGDIFAIAYEGVPEGYIKTVEIAADGAITNSVIDTLIFDSAGYTPSIINVSGDIFAIAYRGLNSDGYLTTVEINTDGQITDTTIDTLESNTVDSYEPDIIHVGGAYFAVAYRTGGDNDGHLATVEIRSDGEITDTIIDTINYDSTQGYEPDIIHIGSDLFAIAYRGSSNDGFIKTLRITN